MRQAIHILLSILLWIVFFYYWYLVTNQAVGSGVMLAIKVLSLLVLIGLVGTVVWVKHNERLARRNRRNTPREAPRESLDTDHVGRRVAAPSLDTLRRARVTEIAVDREDVKSYDVRDGGD